ncbi:DUF4276 family protein [bacterium]|nr:DUF4276 family protein [bacterium]
MHFEILVEDASGKIALESIIPKILGPIGHDHTYRIISYKGVGRIPHNLKGTTDPMKQILLDRLPKLLKGLGKSLQHVNAAVIVVVDLDKKNCLSFKQELLDVLNECNPRPTTLFRIAIEEMEAWLLGDRNAVKAAYSSAKSSVLNAYRQDSICDTWEKLADAIHPGGSSDVTRKGWPYKGQVKCQWVKSIAPNMDVDANNSESFRVFRDGIRRLAGIL